MKEEERKVGYNFKDKFVETYPLSPDPNKIDGRSTIIY